MKKFFKENALKLTIFGNLIALLGPVYFLEVLFWILLMMVGGTSSGEGIVYGFLMLFIIIGYLIVSAIVILGLVLELLLRHRIKNNFFKENKIYNILFYIGLSLTLLSYLFIYAVVFLIH